jgi:hemerythrin
MTDSVVSEAVNSVADNVSDVVSGALALNWRFTAWHKEMTGPTRQLATTIGQLSEAIDSRKPFHEVDDAVNYLLSLLAERFQLENELMQQCEYRHHDDHAKDHMMLWELLGERLTRKDALTYTSLDGTVQWLIWYLRGHAKSKDSDLAMCLEIQTLALECEQKPS